MKKLWITNRSKTGLLAFGLLLPIITLANSNHAPVPACACAPPPARTFLLFFKPGQARLNAENRKLVIMVAHAALTNKKSFVGIEGDASSDRSLNAGVLISLRRADAVAKLLEQNGLPAHRFTVHAFGSTQFLGGDHNSAPVYLQRRVEIWVYPNRNSLDKF